VHAQERKDESEIQRPVRDVTPPGVVRVYRPGASFERAEQIVPEGAMRIVHARLNADGTIVGEGAKIRLYGVANPDPEKICVAASGTRWACGRRAFVAFYNFVNEKDLTCQLMDPPEQIPLANCWVDKVELSVWLLKNGLAELAPGVPKPDLRAALEAAQSGKLGIWSDRPLDAQP
jgi:endonuclease YncB( thermonuclease family)